jgi:hypothetical protein
MASRIIKIILILLAIFFLLLGIMWLIGRHTAQKNGSTPLSFRQFLGLGTKQNPVATAPSENASSFTNSSSNSSQSAANNTAGLADNTQVSQFTDNGLSLYNTGFVGSTNSSGPASTNNSGNQNSSDLNTPSINYPTGTSTPSCSDADTNITFTPEELTELNELQNRFYAIAQTLHTDGDADIELANHDAFAVKADQVTELYNYCEAQLPYIPTDPQLQKHVATPFWDETGSDQTFLTFDPATAAHLTQDHDNSDSNPDTSGISGPYGSLSFSNPQLVSIDGSIVKYNSGKSPDFENLTPVVEKILRINLW